MKMFNVGKVVNTHGIKGDVKVIRITDFEERFTNGSKLFWISKDGSSRLSLEVDGHRRNKNVDLLHFTGYDSINDVEFLKEGILQVSEEQLVDLQEGEFYYHEIIGCTVFTNDGEELGKIKEILAPGANDVWVVQRKGQKDLLIPYIEDVVKEIDLEKEKIIIEPMEGLIE